MTRYNETVVQQNPWSLLGVRIATMSIVAMQYCATNAPVFCQKEFHCILHSNYLQQCPSEMDFMVAGQIADPFHLKRFNTHWIGAIEETWSNYYESFHLLINDRKWCP